MRAAIALCRRHFMAAAGFSALVNLLYIAPTLYMLQVYDRVVPTHGFLTLAFLTIVLLFALATLALLDRIRGRLLVRASVLLDAVLAPALLDAVMERPDEHGSRQALRDFDMMRQTLTGPAALALFDAPWTPIYVLVCFLVHPWIGVVALIGGIALALIAWRNEQATRSRLDRAQSSAAASYSHQDAILRSADSVRALGMREALVRRHVRQRKTMMHLQTEANFATSGYVTGTKFVRMALQSLALGVGALLAINNQISAGAIFASSFLIARALTPIEQLIGSWKSIIQTRVTYRTLTSLLLDKAAGAPRTQLPQPRGEIVLEQVSVFNEARDAMILNGIGLTLASGSVTALVGPSGAGKSTLARTLVGAMRPDRGIIRIDGADQRDWDAERLAVHIGYLPQDSVLFAGTIKENICRFATELGGDRDAIDAAVIAAATKVGAHELILRLAGGYDHMLHHGGRGLSAGQTQRVALARAVYGDPALLVLDEPNAHLDADGDAMLITALARVKQQGTTIVIVSHKLSILPVVDSIAMLRDGRLEAFGARDEILPKLLPPRMRGIPSPSASSQPGLQIGPA